MSNILIIKHGSLGDITQACGAIQDISENHNNDEVHLLTTKPYIDLFKKINQFTKLSFPILVGISRKSMVKKMVGDIENDIIQASVLLACLAVQNGAKILRVHDVKETFNAISVLQAV